MSCWMFLSRDCMFVCCAYIIFVCAAYGRNNERIKSLSVCHSYECLLLLAWLALYACLTVEFSAMIVYGQSLSN